MKTRNWADPSVYLKHIHVAEDALATPMAKRIINRSGLPYTVIPPDSFPQCSKADSQLSLTEGKKHLFLCNNKGNFFKPCPGTSEYNCCGYHVLNIGMNCPMDCVYCILQSYLNQPWISVFVNTERLFAELEVALAKEPETFFRIGTGEFTDSLALERLTGLSRMLVEFMASKDNGILELKTKSAEIAGLRDIEHNGKTILSWSLNSPWVMKSQEIRAASLSQRLQAAKEAAGWGYKLAFHFDPIIYHEGWRQGYSETIELLFRSVPKEAIVWISLGALRYMPSLKSIGAERFPGSPIFAEEFITGLDGKSRYFRTQREDMYSHLFSLLAPRVAAHTCIYFCMESEEIWRSVMGYTPAEKGGVSAMLDQAVYKAMEKY